jgi:hypothetical protein
MEEHEVQSGIKLLLENPSECRGWKGCDGPVPTYRAPTLPLHLPVGKVPSLSQPAVKIEKPLAFQKAHKGPSLLPLHTQLALPAEGCGGMKKGAAAGTAKVRVLMRSACMRLCAWAYGLLGDMPPSASQHAHITMYT